ncbi:YdhK family protein [Aquibacillus kalidii]|uniref:YdhK family protein n=1 Tax=Aquibacillus kalidii TaxID=2762597 RepID=UPI001F227EC6|nr:YdhK family protein [Aquibacillus kalidii]
MSKKMSTLTFSIIFTIFLLFFINQHPHIEALTNPERYYSNMKNMNHHSNMIYNGSAQVPNNLEPTNNPKFPIGSKALSIADHMGGMMDNVKVTIVAAYETTAYATSYTSSTDRKPVRNHKWIVHEELIDIGEKILEPGTKVSTTAEHMKGMKNVVQTVEFSKTTTVYMVDFITTNGEQVTNHKWVIEGELKAL